MAEADQVQGQESGRHPDSESKPMPDSPGSGSERWASDLDFTVGQLRGAREVVDSGVEIDRQRLHDLLAAVVPRLEEVKESARAELTAALARADHWQEVGQSEAEAYAGATERAETAEQERDEALSAMFNLDLRVRELEGAIEKERKLALDAQGPIQTLLGILRLKGEVGSSAIPQLEEAHDAIKRIVDGDNWRERWAAIEAGEPDPGRLQPSPSTQPTPEKR